MHNKCADIKVHVGFTKIFVYSSCLNITVQINIENMSQWSMHGTTSEFDPIVSCPWIVPDWLYIARVRLNLGTNFDVARNTTKNGQL